MIVTPSNRCFSPPITSKTTCSPHPLLHLTSSCLLIVGLVILGLKLGGKSDVYLPGGLSRCEVRSSCQSNEDGGEVKGMCVLVIVSVRLLCCLGEMVKVERSLGTVLLR